MVPSSLDPVGPAPPLATRSSCLGGPLRQHALFGLTLILFAGLVFAAVASASASPNAASVHHELNYEVHHEMIRGHRVTITTHTDPISAFGPPGAAASPPPGAETKSGVAATLQPSWCGTPRTSDDTFDESGSPADPKIRVIYAYPSDGPNNFSTDANMIQSDLKVAFDTVAAASNSTKSLRFDLGTDCGSGYLDITTVHLPHPASYYNSPSGGATTFGELKADVAAAIGSSGNLKRNYLVYTDGINGCTGCGGVGEFLPDDSAGSSNQSNLGGLYAFVYYGYWWNSTDPNLVAFRAEQAALHEVGHTLGAVQHSAPHSSGGAHCFDEYDDMCYNDGGSYFQNGGSLTYPCPKSGYSERWDCNADDYFNPSPPSGSYLSTHWNAYNSVFLCRLASCTPSVNSLRTVGTALLPNSRAGYALTSDGNIAAFGGAPAAHVSQTVPGNLARALVVLPNGKGGYYLDGWGGMHPFAIGSNSMPPGASGYPYWPNWDIARGIVMLPNGTGGYVLDGYGGIHPFAIGSNSMPPGASGSPYWANWDIARGLAINPKGTGGYVLDGYGGVYPFAIGSNSKPPSVKYVHWPGWDIARGVVVDFTGKSGYTLDGYGGVHPFAAAGTPMPPNAKSPDYSSGNNTARGLALYQVRKAGSTEPGAVSGEYVTADRTAPHSFAAVDAGRRVISLPGKPGEGYRLGGNGSLTAYGGAPAAHPSTTWPGWDIARDAIILPDGTGGYVLDGYGGIHPFAIGSNPRPPAASGSTYWSGWDIARGFALNPSGTGGYLLDGYGGLHPFAIGSNAKPPAVHNYPYWPGWDVVGSVTASKAPGEPLKLATLDSHGALGWASAP
jgi:hypothetical protein